MFKGEQQQKGISLIIVLFIMIIMLAVVLYVSILLYSEVKIVRNIGNSVSGLFAADSGIEKVLFYDRKVVPAGAVRGLCSMVTPADSSIPTCPTSSADPSLYCNHPTPAPQPYTSATDPNHDPDGCKPAKCDDCQIHFDTTFDNRTYYVTAQVYPSSSGSSGGTTNFGIESKGVFSGAQRQIKISLNALQPQDAIVINSACAVPVSTPQGQKVYICADVALTTAGDTMRSVIATIHDVNGNVAPGGSNLALVQNLSTSDPDYPCSSNQYGYIWSTSSVSANAYYVDIEVQDNLCPINGKKCTNISPFLFMCQEPSVYFCTPESIQCPSQTH